MPPPRPCGRRSRRSRDLDRRLWTLVAEGRAAWPDLAARRARSSSSSSRARSPPTSPTRRSTGCGPPTSTSRARARSGCPARSTRSTATTCARSTSRSRACGSAPPRLADVKQLVRQRLFVGGGTAGAPTSRRQDHRVRRPRRPAALGPLGRGADLPERPAQGQARDPRRRRSPDRAARDRQPTIPKSST